MTDETTQIRAVEAIRDYLTKLSPADCFVDPARSLAAEAAKRAEDSDPTAPIWASAAEYARGRSVRGVLEFIAGEA